MNASPQNTSERPGLLRGLGLWAAVAVVIGDTIGSGIFLVPSAMAAIVGSEALVFAAWIVGGLIVLCGAFCYAELGATFPKAGGPYAYLNNGLGPLWGFLFGWMSAFLERPVAMATLAAGFARFVGFLFPAVATPLFTLHLFGGEFAVTMAQPLAALVVILVTAVNYLSVKISGAIQMALTSIKVGTIVLIVVEDSFLAQNTSRMLRRSLRLDMLHPLGRFLRFWRRWFRRCGRTTGSMTWDILAKKWLTRTKIFRERS